MFKETEEKRFDLSDSSGNFNNNFACDKKIQIRLNKQSKFSARCFPVVHPRVIVFGGAFQHYHFYREAIQLTARVEVGTSFLMFLWVRHSLGHWNRLYVPEGPNFFLTRNKTACINYMYLDHMTQAQFILSHYVASNLIPTIKCVIRRLY